MGAGSGSSPDQEKDPRSVSTSLGESAAVPPRPRIVLIEDNPADAYLVREALNAHGVAVDLVIIRDGEEAFQLVEAVDHDESLGCPSLFLLDLNLPRRSGEEVLGHIRKSRRCANTPVVIVTSSDAPRDRAETERLGATHYFRKPTSYMGYLKVGEIVKDMLSGPAS